MGESFDKLPSGAWRLRVQYHGKYSQKTKQLSATGKTKKECREKIDEKIKELDELEKCNIANPTVTLENAMPQWLRQEKMGRIKMSSYDRIERTIDTLIVPRDIAKKQVIEIKKQDIDKLFQDIEDKYSLSTRSKVYEALNGFFRHYYNADPSRNPMSKVEPVKRKKNVGEITIEDAEVVNMEDIVLNDDEIGQFKKWVSQKPLGGSVGRSRYGMALYLIMVTCMRYGEAVSVIWGDVNFDRRELTISKNYSRVKDRNEGGDRKTRTIMTTPKSNRSRIVMLSNDAVEALDWIKKNSDHTGKKDRIICTATGAPPTNAQLARVLDGVLDAAGLMTPERKEHFTLHYLRHTGVSYYIRNGIPLDMVSQMVGHSSVAITERVYYHVIRDQREKMVDMMNAIGQKNGAS